MIYDYPAVLLADTDVHDGDTMWLHISQDVDYGFHLIVTLSARIKFRLAQINCPELSTPEGPIARQFTLDWLHAHADGLRVTSLRPDNYGDRWDGIVYSGTDTLNYELLVSGNAVPYK